MSEQQQAQPAAEQPQTPRKRRSTWRRVVRWCAGIVCALLLVTVAATLSLYIPGVPGRVLKWAGPTLERMTGLRISAGNVELHFPANLTVENLLVIDVEATGDTMIAAANARVPLKPTALLRGQLDFSNAIIRNGLYKMGGPDSMYLRTTIDSAGLDGHLNFAMTKVVLNRTDLRGGVVNMIIGPDTTASNPESQPVEVLLHNVQMRDVLYTLYMSETRDTVSANISHGTMNYGRIFSADTVDLFADKINLQLSSGLYGVKGYVPEPGLDFSWMTLRDATVDIDSFKMHGLDMEVPFTKLDVGNFIGLNVESTGVFAMNDSTVSARNFDMVFNGRSRLLWSASMSLDSIPCTPVTLNLDGELYAEALARAYPMTSPLVTPLFRTKPLNLYADIGGSMEVLEIDTIAASLTDVFSISGDATLRDFFKDDAPLNFDLLLNGRLENYKPLAEFLPEGVKLPPLRLHAEAAVRDDDYSGKLTATTAAGRLALDGSMTGRAPNYQIDLKADSFPVAAFMPDMGIGAVSGRIKATGRKFDFFAPDASLALVATVRAVELNGHRVGGLQLNGSLASGLLNAKLQSSAPAADMDVDLQAHLAPEHVDWQLGGDLRNLDLKALGMADSVMSASMTLQSQGYASLPLDSINGTIWAKNLNVAFGSEHLHLDSLGATANAGRRTLLNVGTPKMLLNFASEEPLMPTMTGFGKAADMAMAMIERRNIEPDSLVAVMPHFNIDFNARPGNVIAGFVKDYDLEFNTMVMNVRCDSTLRGFANLTGVTYGEDLRIDTVGIAMLTRNNSLLIDAGIHNRPGTFDDFAKVQMNGTFSGSTGHFFLSQHNIDNEQGYRFGFNLGLTDSIVGLRITPADMIIAYKKWTVNEDNYVAIDPRDFHIHANLDARGDGSRVQLLSSNHTHGIEADSIHTPNDLILRISDVHLQDWLNLNPFAPPIAGDLSADLKIGYTSETINGSGVLSVNKLTYGRKPVGDFDINIDLATAFGGSLHANIGLDIDGHRALNALGILNDTTHTKEPVNMFVQVKEFPLGIVNPFLPGSMAQLKGTLNGRMSAVGKLNSLKLNGNLNFHNTAINVGMMGSTFSLDSVDIPVDSGMMRFNNFAIYGSNDNPLRINGTVDLRKFAVPRMDLTLKAQNMQFINSKKARGVDLFGRGFIDLDASIKGTMSVLTVNADLAILPQTNLTYQMSDAVVAAGLQPEEDVVKFVNFADTTSIIRTDSIAEPTGIMILNASVDVRQGSQFTVNLSSDGQNRAQIRGQGILDYTLNPTQPDGRLTGRFSIDGGQFRYSLPIISEKLFTFSPGSYVAFNGPILDPTLSITATDEVKANVTRSGENSRLVNFNVILKASGTPERLDVAFDLTTKDDITVQNELQGMSAGQRANQALNLLLYGVYNGQNTTGNANLSGNALYGFLTSQLNTWAANAIKGVDLSFGMDQYDRTFNGSTSTATQYSYKVSKSLFNDRFKIVVGGNYSTDADAEENFAQNLISDISFEYLLNQSGSMYVRLFRHTGYESILEGEVTQTGVGFVVKRKVNRLADIFNFIKAAKQ